MTPFLPDGEKLAAVREALPATAAGIYLNAAAVGPLPTETHRAMAEQAERELRVGRASPDDFLELLERMDEARGVIAAVARADPASIVLTHSTDEAMDVATRAIDWRPGDRAVIGRLDRAGALGALPGLPDRFGVELVEAGVGHDDDEERVLAAFDAAVVPRTRLVSIGHVDWTTGRRLPVGRIAELAHARGALIAVDGSQAIGAIPVDVTHDGVDFYAMPAHKWLLGPEGMAALYVASSVVDAVRDASSTDPRSAGGDGSGLGSSSRRSELSAFGRAPVVGMARSIAWLSMYVGLDWVHRRGTVLARSLADRLAAIRGVDVLTPRGAMATLIAFRIAGWSAEGAFDEVSRRSFAIFQTVQGDALRVGVGFYNSEEELERFAATVELVATHTPETIPPRRTLTIIGDGG